MSRSVWHRLKRQVQELVFRLFSKPSLQPRGARTMKMQKFLDWCNSNPESSRHEFVKNFKKLGWTEGAKFTSWACQNETEPTSKKFMFILRTPRITHPNCWE